MRSVVLVTSGELDRQGLRTFFSQAGDASFLDEDRLSVRGMWGEFQLVFAHDSIAGDFPPEELALVEKKVPGATLALLVFFTTAAAEFAINALPAPDGSLIDNDHGLLAPLEEFRRRIRAKIEWETAPD